MADVQWRMQGVEFAACNCNWGCPCQFNSMPSQGKCEAVVGMQIDKGDFDGISLDGLKWVGTFAWPGAIHQGNGRAQVFIDERASEEQKNALLTILSGQETDPGATVFQVFSMMINDMREPKSAPIELSIDLEERTARIAVPGVLESMGEPIRNPVTGQPHRARLQLPNGFEFTEAEMGSSTFSARGEIAISSKGGHGHFARINMNRHGVVR